MFKRLILAASITLPLSLLVHLERSSTTAEVFPPRLIDKSHQVVREVKDDINQILKSLVTKG